MQGIYLIQRPEPAHLTHTDTRTYVIYYIYSFLIPAETSSTVALALGLGV